MFENLTEKQIRIKVFFNMLEHSAPLEGGYSVMQFENVTGKQSKTKVFFRHFPRCSAHGWGRAVVELSLFKLAKSEMKPVIF